MKEDLKVELNLKKDRVQKEARKAWDAGGQWGLLAMATRVGKSKVAIDAIADLQEGLSMEANVLLTVPTRKLRDNNWEEEFQQWGFSDLYNHLDRKCYASINKVKGQHYHLVVLDEGHNLTDANSEFFAHNTVERLMVLSATPPNPKGNETAKGKDLLFQQFRIKTDFHYPTDQAVAEGLIAPYEIRVVETTLDDTQKYIQAGSKAKGYFMITEKKSYEYATKSLVRVNFAKWALLKRMRIVYASIAKTQVAQKLIALSREEENRLIVFCGGIDQADQLGGPDKVFHSKVKGNNLDAFKREEIDELYVVDALNEGHTIPNVDWEIIIQLTSNPIDFIQRRGRSLGLRPDHTAIIWIIVCTDTQDKKWLESALEGVDKSVITYIHAKNL